MTFKNDFFGRIIGFIVFASGIGFLFFVAICAHDFFTAPAHELMFDSSQDLGKSVIVLIMKVLMLIIMVTIGSLIAGKGVQFYHAAMLSRRDEDEKK